LVAPKNPAPETAKPPAKTVVWRTAQG